MPIPRPNIDITSAQILDDIDDDGFSIFSEPSDMPLHNRRRRAIIFRPLFVYRKEQVEKRRLEEEHEKKREAHEEYRRQADQQAELANTNHHHQSLDTNHQNCDCNNDRNRINRQYY